MKVFEMYEGKSFDDIDVDVLWSSFQSIFDACFGRVVRSSKIKKFPNLVFLEPKEEYELLNAAMTDFDSASDLCDSDASLENISLASECKVRLESLLDTLSMFS